MQAARSVPSLALDDDADDVDDVDDDVDDVDEAGGATSGALTEAGSPGGGAASAEPAMPGGERQRGGGRAEQDGNPCGHAGDS
ncbi:hypothetical protein LUX33_20775 [Actinomadura madurae]|uniref:hypothetical protein n=1 Tax=Actinomadura madurae TaxID=1993 RepID=UPI0020D25A68|nr:hypothetical protein [Actinomadura madurae]MCP9950599.1 hypothetical protein [Actinomadura madurae]